MRKVILLVCTLLFTTILQAQTWEPKTWEKYLVSMKVKSDTIRESHSVMGVAHTPKPYDVRLFRTVTGSGFISELPHYKKKSKSIFGDSDPSQSVFAEQDAAIERARMVEGEHDSGFGIFSAILSTVADIIITNLK
ncbi:MAG: hypothetical protein HXN36_02670 [Prevotella histicola]|uniref:hypothetical protein n=1 Tax=Prevotella histicola TaxID=470565 RepID=UPI00046F2F62|nr:hypothetical protein [Prevotella histicola]MBF1393842.1 hypothetical protein [Prevotella histicola]MBS5897436.1 hypothetical protein [Prevotella histicola]MBS6662747.1 hypothetical protein [Prevotella histicola]MBW4739978.1 hypothetical protein [Prevotella histicola]MBW4748241.1 hypothetical protein [Prevotella histicola]